MNPRTLSKLCFLYQEIIFYSSKLQSIYVVDGVGNFWFSDNVRQVQSAISLLFNTYDLKCHQLNFQSDPDNQYIPTLWIT